jgi:hypothetical protein
VTGSKEQLSLQRSNDFAIPTTAALGVTTAAPANAWAALEQQAATVAEVDAVLEQHRSDVAAAVQAKYVKCGGDAAACRDSFRERLLLLVLHGKLQRPPLSVDSQLARVLSEFQEGQSVTEWPLAERIGDLRTMVAGLAAVGSQVCEKPPVAPPPRERAQNQKQRTPRELLQQVQELQLQARLGHGVHGSRARMSALK